MNVLSSALGGASSIDSSSSGARSNSTDKSSDNGFDAMLNSKPATQKPAASKPGSTDTKPANEARGEDSSSGTTTEQSAATDSSTSNDDKPDTQTAAEDAPWPPFGLSAIVTQAAEPAVQAPVALAAANQEGMAAPANPAVTAPPALPAAPAQAPAAAAAKPATISADEASTELSLPLAAAAANDDASTLNLDADTPAPTTFASLLHNQALQEVRASAPASSISAPTPTPDLNSGDFDEAIGARVGWLAEQKIGHAHIRINPENMGQIDVKLQLDGDRVHASFSSAHADVRHALESSLPRLREMLGEQGLQLSHADVGQQSTPQQDSDKGEAGSGLASGSQLEGTDLPVTSNHNLRMRGLLDAYA
ncbi:flagellar hook-length control protein FliK [Stenotrophomonas sp.]|uniref:flagellar hook-length control protein FliK n=1 Tax=Stenotrophomonas sp. TaxID=69392 RepID=UPI0028B0904A|nr:flagellar hook-length control protein FliK [Stenotrophomonas sp.]